MAHLVLKEIEASSFTVDKLIENLTYKSTDGRVGHANFDPLQLEETFKKTIEDLNKINDKSKSKIDALNTECQKEKAACQEKFTDLESMYTESYTDLSQLDKRISAVSSSMSEMSTQLDGLNKPRLNLYESHKTAKYFDKYMEGIENYGVFGAHDEDSRKLEQQADTIYKLHLLANDLISEQNNEQRFLQATQLIDAKYADIQSKLIQSFHQAFFKNDRRLMKKYLEILSNFKDYPQCIAEFIKNCQMSLNSQNSSKDIFNEVVPLCRRTYEIIQELFVNNERVMEQFVKDLFQGRVQTYVNSNIERHRESDPEKYLDTIYLYFNKTKRVFKELATLMKMSPESSFFSKLLNDMFAQQHLREYVQLERTNLTLKFKAQLERFYESIGHTKRPLQQGFVSNLLAKTTNQDGEAGSTIDERFLSHDIATLFIDDTKKAIMRVTLLTDAHAQLPKAIESIYDVLMQSLCKEHIFYALDIHIQALQSMDTKQYHTNPNNKELNLHVLPLVRQLNDIIYLFEQFTNAHVLAPLLATPNYSKTAAKSKQILNELELKVDTCLEKSFGLIGARIKFVLQAEQKKTDFKNETDELSNQSTQACTKCLRLVESQISRVNSCLDGKNVNNALKELGIKFHRCVYDHLFRFEYNELGAMALIRDINEYRLCAKNFNSPVVDRLFSVLYSLCNLLVVKPSNLPVICAGENLNVLNKETIDSFVQLRSDYKTLNRFQFNRR